MMIPRSSIAMKMNSTGKRYTFRLSHKQAHLRVQHRTSVFQLLRLSPQSRSRSSLAREEKTKRTHCESRPPLCTTILEPLQGRRHLTRLPTQNASLGLNVTRFTPPSSSQTPSSGTDGSTTSCYVWGGLSGLSKFLGTDFSIFIGSIDVPDAVELAKRFP